LLKFFLDVFVTLFVIIDPAGTVPVFRDRLHPRRV